VFNASDRNGIREFELNISVSYLKVHGEVEVVELVGVVYLDHRQDIGLGEAHWDVADHQRRQRFLSVEHREEVDFVVGRVAKRWLRRYGAHHWLLVVMCVLWNLPLFHVSLEIVVCRNRSKRARGHGVGL
jgi:hypothetical protein